MEKPWGYSLQLELKSCDPTIIRSKEKIQEYVIKLCKEIDMVRHGDVIIEHFGSGNKEGYTMVQLIETSNITAHFANDTDTSYIDIFSCKEYNPGAVLKFSMEFFGSNEASSDFRLRY